MSCATCHSRNLCITCHVNAPESPVIAALALDERTPAYAASLLVPPSHKASGFLRSHGRDAQSATATCATCHTRESCTSCHIGVPSRAIAAMPGCRSRTRGRSAPDRGATSESHEGVSGTTRGRGERAADGMCKLSCAGELRELPYRSNSTSRCCDAKRCRGPRHERSLGARPTVEPYAGVPGRSRSRSERAAEDVRDVPCALDMSRVPPAGRRAAVAVPRTEFSHAPSELSLRSRSELQRLS
jgi:hypothetical protein